MFLISLSVCLSLAGLSSLVEAGAYLSEARLDRPARDKISSLLETFVSCNTKNFNNFRPHFQSFVLQLSKSKSPQGTLKGGSITVPLTSCLTGLD